MEPFYISGSIRRSLWRKICTFPEVRHSRMLFSGNPGMFGLDPRQKHSGVTILELIVQQHFMQDP